MSYAAAGVSVRIGSASLLAEVSIDVAPGEIVAVAGPNGAGKTTLISTLAGDRRPDAGTVTLAGRALSAWPRGELARLRAVMSTERSVAFGFTVEEVAMLGRLPLHDGDPSAADGAIVQELLEAVDCADLAHRAFATLSTGERQRVALARALAQVHDRARTADAPADAADGSPSIATAERDPPAPERYLLLDEPTSSLDPAHQHLAMRLLRREARAGRGVLAALHDLNLAAAYADRIVLLSHGRVAATGLPADVLRPDVLEPVFSIPMLVIPHPHLPHPIVIAEPGPSEPLRHGAANGYAPGD
jgi:iron complex transport system ATP-binding protein